MWVLFCAAMPSLRESMAICLQTLQTQVTHLPRCGSAASSFVKLRPREKPCQKNLEDVHSTKSPQLKICCSRRVAVAFELQSG